MKKLPLRSRNGCQKCRLRHSKCDEQKPICGNCLRLGFTCSWLQTVKVGGVKVSYPTTSAGRNDQAVSKSVQDLVRPTKSRSTSPAEDSTFIASFDHPALLQESPTSFIQSRTEKSAMQYLFDTAGTAIIRYPTQKYPSFANLNIWRFGLLMAKNHGPQLSTYLAIAAARLSKVQPSFESLATKHYVEAMQYVRAEIDTLPEQPPSESLCAVAAHLSIYEMIAFSSPKARLSHFIAFHRLVEARLRSNLPWGPFQVFLEFYIHCVSDGALFYFDILVRGKPYNYVDEVMDLIDKAPRPLGKEMVGVPKEFTSAAYKLAFILHNNPSHPSWLPKVEAVSQLVYKWQPPYHAAVPEARGLLALGKAYQMACMCLLRKIRGEDCDGSHPDVVQVIRLAASSLTDDAFTERPFVSLGWPCVILGIFAADEADRKVFQNILQALRATAGLEGYRTALEFLSHVWDHDLGHRALDDSVLLATVHI